jgi:hypothetical protein
MQDDAGVPCLAVGSANEVVLMFQWFPGDSTHPDWNSIALRKSLDGGATWNAPAAIDIQGLPTGHSPPADPSLVQLSSGEWRLYFTCEFPGGDAKTWSALSTDLLTFQLESGFRMELLGNQLLDPCVVWFQGMWHYYAPRPGFTDGAIYATSTDGLTFTRQADVVITGYTDTKFLGNAVVVGSELFFFGTLESPGTWHGAFIASSPDGASWTLQSRVTGKMADPGVTQLPSGLFLCLPTMHP